VPVEGVKPPVSKKSFPVGLLDSQVNDLGALCDCGSQRDEIVVPVAIRHGADATPRDFAST